MAKEQPKTIVHLARPVEDGSRLVDAVTIKGETGPSQFPIGRVGENAEIDILALQRVIAARTGLTEVAVSRLSGMDFFGICLALFVNNSRRK